LRNIHHIDKQDKEATKLQSREHRQKTELDYDQIIYQHAQAGRQKKNKEEERNNSEAKPNMIFHKKGYIYKSTSPLTKVLGLHATREFATLERK
jgi:hypothetical protein